MKHTWTLTKNRMQLAMRNRAFVFFSLVMPLTFLFLFMGVIARLVGSGNPATIRYMLAQVLALTVMGSFWGLSIQLVTFREMGILRRFRLAPVGPGAMLASSILSNYILTLPTIVIEFVLARWVFHMDRWGNLLSVLVMVTLGTITFAALGLIIASIMENMQSTQVINNLIWTAFLFFSGATFPLPILPGWLQKLAMFLPATYLVTGLERSMMAEAGPSRLGPELLSLAICAVLAFVISQQLFRWEPETKVSSTAKAWAASTIIPFLLLGVWEMHYGQLRGSAKMDFQAIRQLMTPLNPQR